MRSDYLFLHLKRKFPCAVMKYEATSLKPIDRLNRLMDGVTARTCQCENPIMLRKKPPAHSQTPPCGCSYMCASVWICEQVEHVMKRTVIYEWSTLTTDLDERTSAGEKTQTEKNAVIRSVQSSGASRVQTPLRQSPKKKCIDQYQE
ncbi:hypothetical protein F2P81_012437 [Scophthalmus maximus]|uniref:Uncharacterized protein n=1 Tax=Scophthalmus maximus TaxID=52904 RepID=A0A6A4SPM1_SCOMX|nr:hypothetical protein F2P81_012437 [Scophthalmus maximus]